MTILEHKEECRRWFDKEFGKLSVPGALREAFFEIAWKSWCAALGLVSDSKHYLIYGMEKAEDFKKEVEEEDLVSVCWDIWEHPDKYAGHPLGEPYYDFLKYLWVRYPDGEEIRLAEIVDENA